MSDRTRITLDDDGYAVACRHLEGYLAEALAATLRDADQLAVFASQIRAGAPVSETRALLLAYADEMRRRAGA